MFRHNLSVHQTLWRYWSFTASVALNRHLQVVSEPGMAPDGRDVPCRFCSCQGAFTGFEMLSRTEIMRPARSLSSFSGFRQSRSTSACLVPASPQLRENDWFLQRFRRTRDLQTCSSAGLASFSKTSICSLRANAGRDSSSSRFRLSVKPIETDSETSAASTTAENHPLRALVSGLESGILEVDSILEESAKPGLAPDGIGVCLQPLELPGCLCRF